LKRGSQKKQGSTELPPGNRLQGQPDLSIVIPTLHEERRIGKTLDELSRFLASDGYFRQMTVEVLVVAADTPDRTHEIVLSKKNHFKDCKLLKPGPPVGKGRDVRCGMLRAHGKVIAYMDADLATPLHHLGQFHSVCTRGTDVVIGTRSLLSYRHERLRTIMSYAGNLLFRLASGLWLEDSQCGFKMFTRDAAQLCFSQLSILGWGFDMEVLTIAKSNNLVIATYRLSDWVDVPNGTFLDSIPAIVAWSLRDLAVVAWRRISGGYRQHERSR
jgi:dolichyl-phosphate beta-glucosyltransferase